MINNKQTAAAVLSLYGGEMSEALKPCPYCGQNNVTTDKHVLDATKRGWYAYCRNEDCAICPCTEIFDTEAEAIAAWNTRAGEQAAYEAGRAAGKAEERERIVGRMNARKQTAAIGEERAKRGSSNTLISYYEGELNAIDDMIAIAREEGGT